MYTSASSSWWMRSSTSPAGASFNSNDRRTQMSAVFHSVRTTAPGVPLVPKPPGPSFQEEVLNSGLYHPSAGAAVVKRQRTGSISEVGTMTDTFGGSGNGAHSLALVLSRPAHFFHSARS